MYVCFNHLQLTSSATTVGDRPLRNICQELTITALPGIQFTATPQKANVANQEYTRFDNITQLPLPIPKSNKKYFVLFISFISE